MANATLLLPEVSRCVHFCFISKTLKSIRRNYRLVPLCELSQELLRSRALGRFFGPILMARLLLLQRTLKKQVTAKSLTDLSLLLCTRLSSSPSPIFCRLVL